MWLAQVPTDVAPLPSDLAAWLAVKGPISIAINAFGMQVRSRSWPSAPSLAHHSLDPPWSWLSIPYSPPSSTVMGLPTHYNPSAALGSLTMPC